MTIASETPSNSRRPTVSSHSTIESEKRSLRRSSALGAHLLGRHVRDLALDRPRQRVAHAVHGLRDAEVHQLHAARRRQEDVLRRHVAMDQAERAVVLVALVVDVLQAGADPDRARDRDLERQLLPRQGQRLHDAPRVQAVQVLHGQVVRAVLAAEVEGLNDVGMPQRGRDARLVEEHRHELAVARVLGEDALDRDRRARCRRSPSLEARKISAMPPDAMRSSNV